MITFNPTGISGCHTSLDSDGTELVKRLQIPEPPPQYAVLIGTCRYEHEGYGWRSLYGALYHTWQDILDSCTDFVIEKR